MHNVPHTEEAKRKMSETSKGKHYNPNGEFKKGHKNSEEALKKMKETWKTSGQGKWMKGRKLSEETKKKMSLTQKINNKLGYRFPKGYIPWDKDKKRPEITREKHFRWKGGISKIYKHYNNFEYKIWRKSVFKRDNYTCQECGISGVFLHPHHIKSYTYYPEYRYDIDNGKTLCVPCHHRIHFGNGGK